MGVCGPDFNLVVVDACTGVPIPGATVRWTGLSGYPAYPGGPLNPCAISNVFETTTSAVAGHEGEATITGVWMTPDNISQHRVQAFKGTPGSADYRYSEQYVDGGQAQPITWAVFPVGNCPPPAEPDPTPAGSCAACGQVNLISGPISSLPFGHEEPEGFKGMGKEDPAERCTASTVRVTMFQGKCFPGVNYVPGWDVAGIFGEGGTLPMVWNEPAGVEAAGAATAAMVNALLENQRFLSMQLSYTMTMVERLSVWANEMNQALNTRLLMLQEEVQVLSAALHGEGMLDRCNVSRADKYAALHGDIP